MAGADALAADIERMPAYVSAWPCDAGGKMLLPAEVERRTKPNDLRAACARPQHPRQLRGAARAVGLSDALIERGIVPTRQRA
jgi:hypothetical protein